MHKQKLMVTHMEDTTAVPLVMGNIHTNQPQNVTINGEAGSIIDANSVNHAPIGSVDIAANRESLEYTPDRTRNALTAMVNNMFIDLISRLAKHVESQPTRILASINADKYKNVSHNINRALVQKCTEWTETITIRSVQNSNQNA